MKADAPKFNEQNFPRRDGEEDEAYEHRLARANRSPEQRAKDQAAHAAKVAGGAKVAHEGPPRIARR